MAIVYRVANRDGIIHGLHFERGTRGSEGGELSSRRVVSLYGDRRGSSSERFSESGGYMARLFDHLEARDLRDREIQRCVLD